MKIKNKNDEKWYENILRVEYWNIASASSIKLIINDYSPIRRREMKETTKEILYEMKKNLRNLEFIIYTLWFFINNETQKYFDIFFLFWIISYSKIVFYFVQRFLYIK